MQSVIKLCDITLSFTFFHHRTLLKVSPSVCLVFFDLTLCLHLFTVCNEINVDYTLNEAKETV